MRWDGLNMGVRTELGWACKEVVRLCMVALANRPHYSVYQIVADGGANMCLVHNLVNPKTIQSGS